MGTRRVVADALRLTRLVRKDPGLALLRADLGPMAAAILAEHLGGEVRRRPVAELHELVDEDLAALRDAGVAASRAGRAYCDQWRRAGVLVRATTPGSRRETYELSAPAEAAIRFLVRSGRLVPSPRSRVWTPSPRRSVAWLGTRIPPPWGVWRLCAPSATLSTPRSRGSSRRLRPARRAGGRRAPRRDPRPGRTGPRGLHSNPQRDRGAQPLPARACRLLGRHPW